MNVSAKDFGDAWYLSFIQIHVQKWKEDVNLGYGLYVVLLVLIFFFFFLGKFKFVNKKWISYNSGV
jgi:hypothetical protein